MKRLFFLTSVAVGALAAGAVHSQTDTGGAPVEQGAKNVPEFEPAFGAQTRAPAIADTIALETEEVVDGLVHPWGIAVLPEGGYLVTERAGQLRVVQPDGTLGEPVAGVPDVLSEEQGGLLDVALAEDFAESRRIFLTYSKPLEDNMSATAAATGILSDDMRELAEVQDIFVQFPASPTPMHYGSRIVPDGDVVWITTGEHFTERERDYAQDLDKTYGKVVRVAPDGSAPEDNPFLLQDDAIPSIYSYGHRNIQGAAIRPSTGELWTLEHGPAGGDELNRIEAGENYGWPDVSYGENYDGTPVGTGEPRAEGFAEPQYYWDPVIAPGGFTFYEGEMFDWEGDVIASSLVPGGLVRLTLEGDRVTGEARYLEDVGRVRDVAVDRDGALLVLIDDDPGSVLRVTPEGAD